MPSNRNPNLESDVEKQLREMQPVSAISGSLNHWIAQQRPDVQSAVLNKLTSPPISRAGIISQAAPTHYSIIGTADLGPLIRRARKRIKMSQQQFADASGVGRRFLSELENGKPSLEFDKVVACALAAGIDILAKPRIPF